MNISEYRRHLRNFDLKRLFNELGWDLPAADQRIEADGYAYELTAIAEKRDVHVFRCGPGPDGRLPEYPTRRKIEKRLTRLAHEHLMIFADAAETVQVWHWVARRPGRPDQPREYVYDTEQSGDAIVQKLLGIEFPFSEEESVTLAGAVSKLRDAFDRDRVTKRFYDHFQREHEAFLGFIEGIADKADREWYASLMLNRLMFVYFIQKKGFLADDADYLQNRLVRVWEREGNGKFLDFYRSFLLALFHEGFAKLPAHWNLTPEQREMIGAVPYLNGGLFEVHELEESHPDIRIPDEAFEAIFRFFDQYEWTLDDRPIAKGNEINPDVLGYIFEKYINQKQMGAYYTKEDITEYIGKNTIVPYLFDAARKDCRIAFEPDSSLWLLLLDNPDAYLYPAIKKGVIDGQGGTVPLPDEIAQGIDDPSRRGGWNRPAWPDSPENALPTETWREYAARRKRCLEVREKLRGGEVRGMDDFITHNLNIRQFAQDAVAHCEGPELLRAFYEAVSKVTVLDPACGSGAFLFAALNILEPLYEACLDRMRTFMDDLERSEEPHSPKKFEYFRKALAEVESHPNRSYFILKSIVVHNLYGVDLMEEAVEICKLRLFLKLVAQVDDVSDLEPLPDIDFNIRAGNTLVGYATRKDVQAALGGQRHLGFDDALQKIEEKAGDIDRLFGHFSLQQTSLGGTVTREDKRKLRVMQSQLDADLNKYLSAQYQVRNRRALDKWLASHQPFHWFVEFHGIVARGGFDVIVGNPPYVEYSKVRKSYRVKDIAATSCGNLYAFMVERSYRILSKGGRFGFIVQAPIVSTQRMADIRSLLIRESRSILFATFNDRPSKLFTGIHNCRLAIILSQRSGVPAACVGTTRYYKWYSEERDSLFERIHYLELQEADARDFIPKFRSPMEVSIYRKLRSMRHSLGTMMSSSSREWLIYYKITGVNRWFTFTLSPPRFWRDGREAKSTRESTVGFADKRHRDTGYCCLNSSLHYWLYQARTNCRDFNPADIRYLPLPDSVASGLPEFEDIAQRISDRLEETSTFGSGSYNVGGDVRYQRFSPGSAKDLYDEVDAVLAKHYGFTDEELDFIVNYDIKYRMGDADAEKG